MNESGTVECLHNKNKSGIPCFLDLAVLSLTMSGQH